MRAIAICQISGTRPANAAGWLAGFLFVYNLLLNLLLLLALPCIVYSKKRGNFPLVLLPLLLLLPMVPLSLSEGGGGEIDERDLTPFSLL